jgi:hypothetical protein
VGNNGETLVADSSTTTGLRYNPQNALVNPVINGGMDVWQRGTSISVAASTNAYVADRWQTGCGANQAATISRQLVSDSTNLPNIQYGMRVQRNSGQTGTGFWGTVQSLETVNSIPFAGKAVTLSFYAKRGADYSANSNNLSVYLITGTGTDQNRLSGAYTGDVTTINANVVLTTSYQRFVITGTLPTNMTEMAVYVGVTPTGTAGANDWYEITGVQVDLGTYTASTAPSFRRSQGTIQGELAACQRYYWRSEKSSGYAAFPGYGFTYSTTRVDFTVHFPVQMRIAPTVLEFANLSYQDSNNNTGTYTSVNIDAYSTPLAVSIYGTVSGATANRFCRLIANNAVSATYIAFSAEL